MQLRFDESHIPYWARRYDIEELGERERNLIAMKCQVQQEDYLTKETLREIIIWLHATWSLSEDRIGQYSDNDIRDITSEAFRTTDEDESLLVLARLKGISSTIGSAILHLFHKNKHPIYSFRALQSVGERKEENVVNAVNTNWKPYVEYCRDLTTRNEISIRTLDKALWIHSAIPAR